MENLTIEPVPVVLGRQELVQVQAQGAGTILIDKALAGSVTCAVELDESVTAPVLKGQQLGTLRVEAGGRLLPGDCAGCGAGGSGAGLSGYLEDDAGESLHGWIKLYFCAAFSFFGRCSIIYYLSVQKSTQTGKERLR